MSAKLTPKERGLESHRDICARALCETRSPLNGRYMEQVINLFPMDESEKTEFIAALDKMKRQFAIKHPHINVAQIGYYRFMLMELSRAREMGEQPNYCG